MDIAASIQVVTEEIMLRAARYVHAARVSVSFAWPAVSRLTAWEMAEFSARDRSRISGFSRPPAMRGRAWRGHVYLAPVVGNRAVRKRSRSQQGSLLGPRFRDQIRALLEDVAPLIRIRLRRSAQRVADLLATEQVVGWFEGGWSSVPARSRQPQHPRRRAEVPEMQSVMNLKIKFRESFRPFAPAVLVEHAREYFAIQPEEVSPVHAAGRAAAP